MTLAGTRPPTEDEYIQYKDYHKRRLAVKPGITGMWQVSGRSNITDFEEVVALDSKYIEDWNIRYRLFLRFYLPYSKVIYKLDEVPGGERSVNADRQKLFRDRKGAVKQMRD